MAEYWKSTPKYWCKHCSTYVKDTKFERTQHEATGRHQGNLRRFLRNIQNDHDRNEREKQRAKSEVERLNLAVGGASSSAVPNSARSSKTATPASTSQTTVADRKRQMAQLADMGIAIPDEYRGEMALAGEWQVVSQKPIASGQETGEGGSLSIGVRKRKFEGQEEEEEGGEMEMKKGWGSTTKQYPCDTQNDLEALLAGSPPVLKHQKQQALKQDGSDQPVADEEAYESVQAQPNTLEVTDTFQVKEEDASGVPAITESVPAYMDKASPDPIEVVFKKRKSKSTRQK